MTQRLLIPIFFIIIIITSVKSSPNENCKFANTKGTPCILITIPNSNKISKSISSKTVITRDQIRENNLIDLPSVLKYVNGINLSQSGSVGQQTSVFMRGTNSNHVLVLLNGIPINDQSKTSGQYDFGQDFMYNISQVEIYKGSSGAHFGSDAIGGAINFVTNVDFNSS